MISHPSPQTSKLNHMHYKFKLLVVLALTASFACQQKLKVTENQKILFLTESFPEKDTTILVNDFYITYKKSGKELIGAVEPMIGEHPRADFKSTGNIVIELDSNQFRVTGGLGL